MTMFNHRTARHGLPSMLVAFCLVCCADDLPEPTSTSEVVCEPIDTQPCACRDGRAGLQDCAADRRSWTPCVCGDSDPDVGEDPDASEVAELPTPVRIAVPSRSNPGSTDGATTFFAFDVSEANEVLTFETRDDGTGPFDTRMVICDDLRSCAFSTRGDRLNLVQSNLASGYARISRFTFAEPGTYYVGVDAWNGAAGTFLLDVMRPSAPPDPPDFMCEPVVGSGTADEIGGYYEVNSQCLGSSPVGDFLTFEMVSSHGGPTALDAVFPGVLVVTEAVSNVAAHMTFSPFDGQNAGVVSTWGTRTAEFEVWFHRSLPRIFGAECPDLPPLLGRQHLAYLGCRGDSGSVSANDSCSFMASCEYNDNSDCLCSFAVQSRFGESGRYSERADGRLDVALFRAPDRGFLSAWSVPITEVWTYDLTGEELVIHKSESGHVVGGSRRPEAPSVCERYCTEFQSRCHFFGLPSSVYDDYDACVDGCADMAADTSGLEPVTRGDSIECRLHHARAAILATTTDEIAMQCSSAQAVATFPCVD